MKKRKKNNRGFTLVELIIVIAIIAVLAAVAVPQYIKYVEKSRAAVCKSNISMLQEAYYIEVNSEANGNYKDNLTAALADFDAPLGVIDNGDTCTATVNGLCPSDGTCSITISKQTGAVIQLNCSKHGAETLAVLTAGKDSVDILHQAFSSLLAAKKITLSGGRFDVNGTRQTPIIKDAMTAMGYTISDNTMWKIVAKSESEYCIYMADLTDAQMDVLNSGNRAEINKIKVAATQVYYENGVPTTTQGSNVSFDLFTANDSTYTAISNTPALYKSN